VSLDEPGAIPATGSPNAYVLVWLILTQPTTAAHIVNSIFAILKTAATNVTNFFTQILS